jgi:ribosomal protein L44E
VCGEEILERRSKAYENAKKRLAAKKDRKRKRENDGLGSKPRKVGKEEKATKLKAHQQQMEKLWILLQACRIQIRTSKAVDLLLSTMVTQKLLQTRSQSPEDSEL